MLHRRLQRAMQAGLSGAARRLRQELRSAISRLREQLSQTYDSLAPSVNGTAQASAQEIYADLLALHQEFEEVQIDLQEQTVSVTTEPLELEGVYLGPFAIHLDWKHPSQRIPLMYRVSALDPHPASSAPDVTHPHVQNGSVCEGKGAAAITSALQQGRLLDLFTIVANLLRSYNAGSPYVSLSIWHGVECADCGAIENEEDATQCQGCDTSICIRCQRECGDCHHPLCSECSSRCEACHDAYCDDCLKPCRACSEDYCPTCLTDQICRSCHDESENDETIEETASKPGPTAAIQSDSLGETAVPT